MGRLVPHLERQFHLHRRAAVRPNRPPPSPHPPKPRTAPAPSAQRNGSAAHPPHRAPPTSSFRPILRFVVPRVEACARCRLCGGQAGAGCAGMPPDGRNGGFAAEGGGADAFHFRAEDSVQDHGLACLTAGHHSDVMQFGYPSEVVMPRQEPSHDTSRRSFIRDPQRATQHPHGDRRARLSPGFPFGKRGDPWRCCGAGLCRLALLGAGPCAGGPIHPAVHRAEADLR